MRFAQPDRSPFTIIDSPSTAIVPEFSWWCRARQMRVGLRIAEVVDRDELKPCFFPLS